LIKDSKLSLQKKIIKRVEDLVLDPSEGLPDEVFYFIGRITPFINVDLLIRHPMYGTLLTWRDDPYAGKGWHIPGGIIRFREKAIARVRMTAKKELGVSLSFINGPIDINEIIVPSKRERSHFISLLFDCSLSEQNYKKLHDQSINNSGFNLCFCKKPPKNLIEFHNIYKKFF